MESKTLIFSVFFLLIGLGLYLNLTTYDGYCYVHKTTLTPDPKQLAKDEHYCMHISKGTWTGGGLTEKKSLNCMSTKGWERGEGTVIDEASNFLCKDKYANSNKL